MKKIKKTFDRWCSDELALETPELAIIATAFVALISIGAQSLAADVVDLIEQTSDVLEDVNGGGGNANGGGNGNANGGGNGGGNGNANGGGNGNGNGNGG